MVIRAKKTRELIIVTRNKTGVGNEIFQTITSRGMNVIAFHGYTLGRDVVLTLITDDNTKTKRVLKGKNLHADSREVILIECPNKPGVFNHITSLLSENGVDIDYAYATSTSKAKGMIVLNTIDNRRAMKVLN